MIPYDVTVLIYEPTWHAVRIGLDEQIELDRAWSITGEFTVIPYARLRNDDSHLLRQSPADLGPAPNIINRSNWSYGAEAEIFVNYALTKNLDLGAGVRYWGLFTHQGDVEFGPNFRPASRSGTLINSASAFCFGSRERFPPAIGGDHLRHGSVARPQSPNRILTGRARPSPYTPVLLTAWPLQWPWSRSSSGPISKGRLNCLMESSLKFANLAPSVPNPKSASFCGLLGGGFRIQRTLGNLGL